MAKKASKSLDKLRADVQALSEAVWSLQRQARVEAAAESAANGSRTQKHRKMAQLEARAAADGASGLVTTWGTYRLTGPSGDRKVRWQVENAPVEHMIPDDLDGAAATLAAMGHRQRLAILLALLRQPSSASDLVTTLELGTTGAAYHHLKALQGAGLVVQETRGVFAVAPDQVGRLIGIFAALATEATVEAVAPTATDDGEIVDEA